jgi:anti-sigma B factor antagonist
MTVMERQPFEIWEARGLPVVSAPDEVDVSNAGQLRSALLAAAAGHPTIVIDLSATQFCDSSGLSVLVGALRRAMAEGGEVRLVARTPGVLRILGITGVGSLFALYTSLEEALAPGRPGPVSALTLRRWFGAVRAWRRRPLGPRTTPSDGCRMPPDRRR